jgi:aminoglycoside phosphotransferase (APT) family kinase protein
VDDEEIAACVAEAVGGAPHGASVHVLSGKQGLIVARVNLPLAGSFVFKAVKESSRRELALTEFVSRFAPAASPRVLAVRDDVRRALYWLVMEDVGDRRLADAPTVEAYAEAARSLANLQLVSLDTLADLHAMGVPVVDPGIWEEIALRTLDRAATCGSAVVRSEMPYLEAAAWDVTDVAADTLTVPLALVHGDIHAGNIVLSADGACVKILDWGSAYVGAAFLGLEELLWPAARHLGAHTDVGPVRAAYLRAWEPLLGRPGHLERAVAACRVLVRLELVDEALRRPAHYDEFAVATTVQRLAEAWRTWKAL